MDNERQKVINEILLRMNSNNPSIYYLSTSDIAALMIDWIKNDHTMPKAKKDLLKDLSQEEIQYLLSFDEHRVDPL